MKKGLIITATIILLAGCGKKGPKTTELKCSKTISDSKSDVVYEIDYKFEDDVLKDVNSYTSLTFTTEGLENLETFKTYAESSRDVQNKKDGVTAKLTTSDNNITIDITYDIAKMSEDEKNINLFNENLETIKKSKEKEEYICK